MSRIRCILLLISFGMSGSALCQPTVFSILHDPMKLADKHFSEKNYLEAIKIYESLADKDPVDPQVQLRLAQSFYWVKRYKQSVSVYDTYLARKGNELPSQDLYYYAEAQVALKNYLAALVYYRQCLEHDPGQELVTRKIWQLKNIQYLFEDSAHYAIRPLSVNTGFGELCPIPYGNRVVFTSNRKGVSMVEKVNGKLDAPYYQLYSATWSMDTTTLTRVFSREPVAFARNIKSKYNTGPASIYKSGTKMAFVASSEKKEAAESPTLGIYFASMKEGKWSLEAEYPFNSAAFSINDVTISEDGSTLYFSSDKKGGMGGKDIYISQWSNDRWTTPRNVGEPINTPLDEAFPSVYGNTLYFSSDGHAGLGQLDIFKAHVTSNGYSEPQNMGHPLNSSYDDFGVSFDSLAMHGYFTSNRRNGGYDDDLYEFDMDLQTYPFTIVGVLKYKEHTWSDPLALHIWPKVKIVLVDSWSGIGVFEIITDEFGNFSIDIPYFSQFYIQIVDNEGHEHKASLEIQKYRKETNTHEIVVVKDIFKQPTDR